MGYVPLTVPEIEKMRLVCRLAAQSLRFIETQIRPGISLIELDDLVAEHTRSLGCQPACLNYHGYPRVTCISVNSVVCHGLPDKSRLSVGDIVNVDITHLKDGFYGDCSATFIVDSASEAAIRLVQAAKEARDIGILECRPGATTEDIGFAINKFATRRGYTTVREIGGHGIGKKFHDEPFVPSQGKKGRGVKLMPWQCITVEPMLNEGTAEINEFDIPDSTIKYYKTADGKLSAQFEHTVLITETGHEILTIP